MRLRASALVLLALAACGDGTEAVTERTGCDGAKLLSNPTDPAAPGPWPVGARTVAVGRLGTVEIWYPATRGSERGQTRTRYDVRASLNVSQRTIVPDADAPWQDCDCYRDLPLDETHGPYPAVIFVHGTAGFRHQSLSIATHWASRGFIVVAADHPGLYLGDLLTMLCPDPATGPMDLAGDLAALVGALGAPAGDLAFLAGHVDATRLAVAGHSAGANAAAAATGLPGVRVAIVLAGNRPAPDSATLERVLFMSGANDTIIQPADVHAAWAQSATPRYYVDIVGAGHLGFSDLCETKNAAGKNLLQIGEQYQLGGVAAAGALFDCNPAYIAGPIGWDIVDFASSALLEPTLQCATTVTPIDRVDDQHPQAHAYEESL